MATAVGAAALALGLAVSANLIGTAASAAGPRVPAPTVTGISPSSGPGSGHTLVTITGTNFTGATKVFFASGSGESPSPHFTVVSSTEIRASSPPGDPNDDAYDIVVHTPSGPSATSSADQFTYNPDATPGKIAVQASNLSIGKGDKLTITGWGWTPGLLVIVTICNADASNVSPLTQLSHFDLSPDACEPVAVALSPRGSFAEVGLYGSHAGRFTWTGTIIPGQLDPPIGSPLAECPQGQAQAAQGVNCIVGVAELLGFASDGNTADQPIFFAPPKLSFADTWQSGLGSSAAYNLTISDAGAFEESGDPPVASANGVPNTGGFATDGVICEPGTGPGTSVACAPEFAAPSQNKQGVWFDQPVSCQAASSAGGTSWSSLPVCTFGAAGGESIKIELVSYTAPKGTELKAPFPLGTPLDCQGGVVASDPFSCTVSADAGPAATDAGGFSTDVTNALTGQSPPAALNDLPPGTYSFAAIGGVSGNSIRGTVTLPLGPSS